MIRTCFILLLVSLPACPLAAQYNWKLTKEKDQIKVFTSEIPNSSFKAVKVECTIPGNYAKLISVLTDVEQLKEWVYHNKSSVLLKRNSPHDLIYYSETAMPFPISNRDVVIHMKIRTDSLPKFLLISGNAVEGMVPEIPTRVRVPKFNSSWTISMSGPNSLRIKYIVELDPGGALPAWAVNMFSEKGPYGTFIKLSEMLGK